jgi:hypothetical protein
MNSEHGMNSRQFGNCKLAIENVLAGMTRLELANQLIENQPAFHFAFIPVVRVERFELITKLVLSQPPLPIGLHAQVDLNWYSREDSNL